MVRLLHQASSAGPGRSRQQQADKSAQDTTRVSHSKGHTRCHRSRPGSSPNHRTVSQSFHVVLLDLTGAHWLDDPPDVSCKETTRQVPVDDPRLSCKQQVGGSSPPASSPKTAGHKAYRAGNSPAPTSRPTGPRCWSAAKASNAARSTSSAPCCMKQPTASPMLQGQRHQPPGPLPLRGSWCLGGPGRGCAWEGVWGRSDPRYHWPRVPCG